MSKPVKTPPLPFPHSYWVLPGRLLAGEHPSGKDQAETQHRVDCLTIAGITFYVDLTEPDECPAYRHLLPRKAKYVRSAIADMEVPDSVTQMQLIQTRIAAALTIGHGVYVHCQAGIGRTGTAMGCFLVEQGLGGAAALKQLNKLWRRSVRAKTWPKIPQTPWQADYIQMWPRHRKFHNRTRVG